MSKKIALNIDQNLSPKVNIKIRASTVGSSKSFNLNQVGITKSELEELLRHDKKVMNYLQSKQKHMDEFMSNPVQTLINSKIDLSPSLVRSLKKQSKKTLKVARRFDVFTNLKKHTKN